MPSEFDELDELEELDELDEPTSGGSNTSNTSNTSSTSPLLSLPPLPNESPRAYEAFSFWVQTDKNSMSTSRALGAAEGTVRKWKKKYRWDERAMEFEQARAMVPYSKEQAVNDMLSDYAIRAGEAVTATAMEDYHAMVAVWRESIQIAAERVDENGVRTGLSAKELREFFAARDTLDQIGRRIARLPQQYKQGASGYGVNSPTLPGTIATEDEELSWK